MHAVTLKQNDNLGRRCFVMTSIQTQTLTTEPSDLESDADNM